MPPCSTHLCRPWSGARRILCVRALLINSIDLTKMLRLIGEGELGVVTEYLAGEVGKLAWAGADCAVPASNTPHIVFDELQRRATDHHDPRQVDRRGDAVVSGSRRGKTPMACGAIMDV
jgi:hypothetical protein